MNAFEEKVSKDCRQDLFASKIRVLQVNLGYKCNQSCLHCHLECGPGRPEMMDWETMAAVLRAARLIRPEKTDITGGAPELNPHFTKFVEALRELDRPVQVRTNLTVLTEPGLETLPVFFRDHQVHLVASLPCYLEENVRRQRGLGVYEKSIQALQLLNRLGYGRDPALPLFLVYNPGGPVLPPRQTELEADYRRELDERFGIRFTALLTITNMPIGRFWEGLKREKKDEAYRRLLLDGFNCRTVSDLMCRQQISVAWNGMLYDCDFNLALGLSLVETLPNHIRSLDPRAHAARKIRTAEHCFGCTAGFGSSCGGALAAADGR